MGQQDLEARGTSAVLPEQPAFLSSHHALVAREQMEVTFHDSTSFSSKSRRIQRLSVGGYKG